MITPRRAFHYYLNQDLKLRSNSGFCFNCASHCARIPVSKWCSKTSITRAVGNLATTGSTTEARPKSVLVVADHDLVRSLIVEILENAGLAVMQAGNGNDALDLVRTEGSTIGCILQDMSMPGMSGPETITEILAIMPQANIIVLSVDEEFAVRQELGDLKVAGCLEKPCDSDLLVDTVRPFMV